MYDCPIENRAIRDTSILPVQKSLCLRIFCKQVVQLYRNPGAPAAGTAKDSGEDFCKKNPGPEAPGR